MFYALLGRWAEIGIEETAEMGISLSISFMAKVSKSSEKTASWARPWHANHTIFAVGHRYVRHAAVQETFVFEEVHVSPCLFFCVVGRNFIALVVFPTCASLKVYIDVKFFRSIFFLRLTDSTFHGETNPSPYANDSSLFYISIIYLFFEMRM